MEEYEYKCIKCGGIWGFFPEDYENPEDYPDICPFCRMPLSQMIKEIYQEEGLWAVIKQIFKRI